MEEEYTLEDQVLTNFKLLDFPNFEVERDLKVTLERDMFRKANSRALETLLYFLFSRLASEEQRLAFMFSWPPRTPSMRREFRDEAFKLLQILEAEEKLPRQSILGKSVLETAQGERALVLLKKVSDATVCHMLKTEFGVPVPKCKYLEDCLNDQNLAVRGLLGRTKRALTLKIQIQVDAFKKIAGKAVASQRNWIQRAEELTTNHKELRTSLDLFRRPKLDKPGELMEQLAALDRVPQIDVLRYMWKKVEDLSRASEGRRGRALICGLLENSKNTLEISSDETDGKKRPDLQVDKWTRELAEIRRLLGIAKKNSDNSRLLKFVSQISTTVTHAIYAHTLKLANLREVNSKLSAEVGRLTLKLRA